MNVTEMMRHGCEFYRSIFSLQTVLGQSLSGQALAAAMERPSGHHGAGPPRVPGFTMPTGDLLWLKYQVLEHWAHPSAAGHCALEAAKQTDRATTFLWGTDTRGSLKFGQDTAREHASDPLDGSNCPAHSDIACGRSQKLNICPRDWR